MRITRLTATRTLAFVLPAPAAQLKSWMTDELTRSYSRSPATAGDEDRGLVIGFRHRDPHFESLV